MITLPTFGFKGTILPILDKNDQLHLFIKNECDYRILLNIVTFKINKFINLEKDKCKLVNIGNYQVDLQVKVFYMGQELFDFFTKSIDKQLFYLFSDYIINTIKTDIVSVSVVFLDGIKIYTNSEKLQYFYVKIVDKNTNKIIHENNFISNVPYVFNPETTSKFNIEIFDSNGQKIYYQDI